MSSFDLGSLPVIAEHALDASVLLTGVRMPMASIDRGLRGRKSDMPVKTAVDE